MKNTFRILLALTIITNSSCSKAPTTSTSDGQPAQASFRCDDTLITTTFSGDSMDLEVNGEHYMLTRTRSGSGARYEYGEGAAHVLFWEHAGQARVEIGPRAWTACGKVGALDNG